MEDKYITYVDKEGAFISTVVNEREYNQAMQSINDRKPPPPRKKCAYCGKEECQCRTNEYK